MNIDKKIEEFDNIYTEAYKDILPDIAITKGIEWHKNFLRQALEQQKQEIIEEVEKMKISDKGTGEDETMRWAYDKACGDIINLIKKQ